MDPYAMMMHYKRAFKLLDAMKRNSAKVLILGHLDGQMGGWRREILKHPSTNGCFNWMIPNIF